MSDFNSIVRFLVAAVGIFLSIYSLNVEFNAMHNPNYKAMCDINEKISCTKVFTSKYGRGFGIIGMIFGDDSILNIPNPIFGIVFYGLMMVLSFFPYNPRILGLLTVAAMISCVMSVYLATILYHLKDICVVCISTYVVNFSLLYLNFKKYNELKVASKFKEE